MPRDALPITSETLLTAYASGVFPMAERRNDPEIFWVDPRRRGIMPLDGFRMSRSLARTIRRGRFSVTLNRDFAGVVQGCAERDETWINAEIAALCGTLHRDGDAHSLEVWDGDTLAGGIYGVTMGTAFFGESMFSRRRDASKVAMAWTVALLRARGFTLFDTQFLTEHLASMGGMEISRAEYRERLAEALAGRASFDGAVPDQSAVVHLRTQTS